MKIYLLMLIISTLLLAVRLTAVPALDDSATR
jgi:hypothetical protein